MHVNAVQSVRATPRFHSVNRLTHCRTNHRSDRVWYFGVQTAAQPCAQQVRLMAGSGPTGRGMSGPATTSCYRPAAVVAILVAGADMPLSRGYSIESRRALS